MMTEEIRVTVNGMELVAKQWGEPELPAIIALHGWLDNAASFDRLAPALSGHRVIALDFAGHGFSAHRPEGVRYHMLDNVDDVIGVADALGLDRFVLMGHSMGAGTATYVAGSFPERISKLILIEGIGTNTNRPEQAPDVLRKAVTDMKKFNAKRKPVYETRDDAIHARAHAIGSISVDASTHICNRGLVAEGEGFTWRSDPRLKMSSAIRLTEEMVDAYLQKLSMPVLLIRGRHSFFATEQTLQSRADRIAGCQQVLLDGNHHLHLEPDTFAAVAQAALQFLQG
jgi:pimeloyl-ACP methyl ester carboxylesterase